MLSEQDVVVVAATLVIVAKLPRLGDDVGIRVPGESGANLLDEIDQELQVSQPSADREDIRQHVQRLPLHTPE